MRKQSEYTRRLCRPYKASNEAASPRLARSIASASVIPPARIFFACVNGSLIQAAPLEMRQSSWTVVSTEFSGAFAARLAPLGLPVQVPGPEKLWTASISSIFFLLWLLGAEF